MVESEEVERASMRTISFPFLPLSKEAEEESPMVSAPTLQAIAK